ncbi:hypothetical protein LY76DRAFT_301694 [Colletotrichum caudatum]|nr:hypothetical protein LY76DRAFT_301694 [Colletotrichum caudatum]
MGSHCYVGEGVFLFCFVFFFESKLALTLVCYVRTVGMYFDGVQSRGQADVKGQVPKGNRLTVPGWAM